MIPNLPYWRLSGFYFFAFAVLGSFIPYWGLYLGHLGFDNLKIGLLMAIFVSARIFAPLFFGYFADASQKSVQIIKISTALMLVVFIVLSGLTSFWWLAFFMFFLGFLQSGLIPQFDSLTLDFLGTVADARPEQYSLLRLWGSVGFIVSVVSVGFILEQFFIKSLPIFIGLVIFFGLLVTLSIPNINIQHLPNTLSFRNSVFNKSVLIFLVVCMLHQASHGAYYTYFSIFLVEHGYDKITIGLLWSVGVFAEIMIFIYSPKILTRFNQYHLLKWALIFTSLRWITTSIFIDDFVPLFLSQFIHAISFGLFHIVAIKYTQQFFPQQLQARGQAIYSIASFGIGAVIGSVFVSFTWEIYGGELVFLLSAIISMAASFIWIIGSKCDNLSALNNPPK